MKIIIIRGNYLNDKFWCANMTKIVRECYVFVDVFFLFFLQLLDGCQPCFYGTRTCTLQAHVPENPQYSDADLSDVDDPIEDPDYHPFREEVAGDSYFESLDEDDAPSTSTSSKSNQITFIVTSPQHMCLGE